VQSPEQLSPSLRRNRLLVERRGSCAQRAVPWYCSSFARVVVLARRQAAGRIRDIHRVSTTPTADRARSRTSTGISGARGRCVCCPELTRTCSPVRQQANVSPCSTEAQRLKRFGRHHDEAAVARAHKGLWGHSSQTCVALNVRNRRDAEHDEHATEPPSATCRCADAGAARPPSRTATKRTEAETAPICRALQKTCAGAAASPDRGIALFMTALWLRSTP
jgi:hypothetical protein